MIKTISLNYSKYDVKTPIEKVVEILNKIKKTMDNNLIIRDINWSKKKKKIIFLFSSNFYILLIFRSIEMISSNKLYDPLCDKLKE